MQNILIPSFLILFGLGFCWLGYSRWKGKMHWSYFDFGFFQETNYMAIPIGISSLLIGITILPVIPSRIQPILISLSSVILILGLIFSWRIFKPDWLKWVETHHKDVIPYLKIEVRDHGWPVETQQDLEDWIATARRKYQEHL